MSIYVRQRRQDAVYWAPNGIDQFSQPQYLVPVGLKVRWVDGNVEYLDKQGRTMVSSAMVYTGEDVKEGGVLWLGSIDDVNLGDNPYTDTDDFQNKYPGASEIKKFEKAPNVKATRFLRTAFLGVIGVK